MLDFLRVLYMLYNKDEVGYDNAILNIGIAVVFIMVLGSGLIFVPGMIAAVFLIRWAVIRKVRKTMRMHAGGQDEALLELETEEEESQTTPVFVTTDANSSIHSFAEFRETVVKRAQRDLHQKFRKDARIAFGHFGLALLWDQLFNGNALANSWFATACMMIGGVMLMSVTFRWLFMAKQYRPVDAHYKKFFSQSPIKIFGQELANVFHNGGTNILLGVLIGSYVFSSIADGDYPSALGLMLMGGGHFYLLMRSKSKAGLNIKLLILRTFSINENSLFTFGRLINYWKHVGNHFTVVDSSYIKHKYRILSQRTIGVVLLLSLPPLVLLNLKSPLLYPLGLLSPFVLALIFIAFEYIQIERSFIKSRETIQARITRLEKRPRGLAEGTFTGIPTMCHVNTWRGTVAEMVKTTDIVMMDLRGFSEEKKGCEYEIDFLLDNICINRVLILIDTQDDQEFIRGAILARWKYLRIHSPNLGVTDPKIQIYISSEQNEVDVQGIFDLLLGTAFLSGRVAGSLVS